MLETPKVLLKNLQDCKIHFIGIGGDWHFRPSQIP